MTVRPSGVSHSTLLKKVPDMTWAQSVNQAYLTRNVSIYKLFGIIIWVGAKMLITFKNSFLDLKQTISKELS